MQTAARSPDVDTEAPLGEGYCGRCRLPLDEHFWLAAGIYPCLAPADTPPFLNREMKPAPRCPAPGEIHALTVAFIRRAK